MLGRSTDVNYAATWTFHSALYYTSLQKCLFVQKLRDPPKYVSFVAFVRNESDQSIQNMLKRLRPNTAISAVISVADSDPKYVSGIQTVTLNYGSGSGSFLFVKDLKKFKKKYQYFIIHNDFLLIIQYRYFFHWAKKYQIEPGSGRIHNWLASWIRISQSELRLRRSGSG
jgi:hypothetical protein